MHDRYGPAGLESEPEEKDKEKDFHKKPMPTPATSGVRGLLNTITSVRVDEDDDFVALGGSLIQHVPAVMGRDHSIRDRAYEPVHEVGPDEPGASGHQRSHCGRC